MQSIYRFRQAEVAIFMQFWAGGVSNLQLEPVRLATNFRSAPAIVEWVNATFLALLPAADDPATGAVSFAAWSGVQARGFRQRCASSSLRGAGTR